MAHTIVIFGASGDLTSRKLIPALYRQFLRKKLPADTRIVGVARSPFSDDQWRTQLTTSTSQFSKKDFSQSTWATFANQIFYQAADIASDQDFRQLAQRLDAIEQHQPTDRTYYLSTMPQLYAPAIAQLGKFGLAKDSAAHRRVVIEKPFGTDLATAQHLNTEIHHSFREDQIYRIDHYLGKETVQNILVLRFGNSIFEPLWNRRYIDHVQITVGEEVLVGRRGGYYDQSGILRDMFQNHLFQLMMIIAMEAPVRFNANMVRDEKVKVLHAIRPWSDDDFRHGCIRGQYQGYRQEEGVPTNSQTETFAALRLYVDNWRWKGVPFYLRSGKAMSCRSSQIIIQFREPPHVLFGDRGTLAPEGNRLVIQVQPAEGLQLHFQSKVPEAEMRMRMSELAFRFDQSNGEMPDAYQRLLSDAVNGDASLFARSDEVEQAWRIIDPIMQNWRSDKAPPLHNYPVGEWGPKASQDWIEKDGRYWFDVCPVL